MTNNADDHYIADPVRDLARVVNGMTYKVSVLDRAHKAKARTKGKPLVVSLSDRLDLGWVRSGIAYDPATDCYYVVFQDSVGVPPRRFLSFAPALAFARSARGGGGEPMS